MLDKLSKDIIKQLQSTPDGKLYYGYNRQGGNLDIDDEDVMAAIRYLHDKGIISTFGDGRGQNIGIVLNHKARQREEFKKIDAIEYLKSNYLAIIALIISIGAFIKSFFF